MSIFQQLCPGYSDQPHAALEHIRQSAPGPDGQMVTASFIEYFQRMMNAARPFATEQTYAISVCDRFIQGLDRRLLPCFQRMYPAHSTVHNMNGAYQRQQLPVILAAKECRILPAAFWARGFTQILSATMPQLIQAKLRKPSPAAATAATTAPRAANAGLWSASVAAATILR